MDHDQSLFCLGLPGQLVHGVVFASPSKVSTVLHVLHISTGAGIRRFLWILFVT